MSGDQEVMKLEDKKRKRNPDEFSAEDKDNRQLGVSVSSEDYKEKDYYKMRNAAGSDVMILRCEDEMDEKIIVVHYGGDHTVWAQRPHGNSVV
ncbi:unnamed protein product, partial [Allacma fusca]